MYLNNNDKTVQLVALLQETFWKEFRKAKVKEAYTGATEQHHFPTDAGVWISVKLTSNFLASAKASRLLKYHIRAVEVNFLIIYLFFFLKKLKNL